MASIKLKGDTSGEITISAPAVAGTNTISLQATTGTLATTAQVDSVYNSLGVRNLIINGDMRIAQRGTSATGITTSGYHTIDRWQTLFSGAGTFTVSQDTDVPSGQGFANSLKLDCTTANSSLDATDFIFVVQKMEGQNLQHLKYGTSSAESLTVSFWIKSNLTGNYVCNLYSADNSQLISASYTVNTADTWEKKTLTFSGDTTNVLDNDNNKSLELEFWFTGGSNFTSGTLNTSWTTFSNTNRNVGGQTNLGSSTSNYINITGVQLEIGSATPFEHRPYDMELIRCQRYCTVISGEDSSASYSAFGYGYNSSGTRHECICYLPTKMRATPSLTITASQWQISSVNTAPTASTIGIFSNQSSTNSVQVYADTSGLTQAYPGRLETKGSTTAKAILSAEL